LLKVLGEKVGWDNSDRESIGEDLVAAFGTLYASFEEAAMNEGAIVDAGFEGEWIKDFVEIAIENIIPPFVEIKGSLNLSINVENGVLIIKQALQSAEEYTSEEDEISVMCFYDGAPEYRIVLKAPDFKTAEDLWQQVSDSIVTKMEESGGQATTFRD
jgi:translation initiation factor 2 subunit 1